MPKMGPLGPLLHWRNPFDANGAIQCIHWSRLMAFKFNQHFYCIHNLVIFHCHVTTSPPVVVIVLIHQIQCCQWLHWQAPLPQIPPVATSPTQITSYMGKNASQHGPFSIFQRNFTLKVHIFQNSTVNPKPPGG